MAPAEGNAKGHLMHRENVTRRLTCLVALVASSVLVAVPQQPKAQEIGDVAAGRQLSATWCSSCHLVAPSASSGIVNGAPTFRIAA